MAKKRDRFVNSQPFLSDFASVTRSRKRSKKAPKIHQRISSGISSNILTEALAQQREIEAEKAENFITAAFAEVGQRASCYEEEEEEEYGFDEFYQAEIQYDYNQENIDGEQEKLLEEFLSKNAASHRTLTDIIIEKMKGKDANFASARPIPKLDTAVVELYKGVGNLLGEYTSGRLPKAFKHIASMECWEDVLHLTEPENWSPNAMLEATRIFASNFTPRKAERFYEIFLLPRVREDIRKHKTLCQPLYNALKKAMFKHAAFNKGILLALCESGTCSLKEAVTLGSIIKKAHIPVNHSSAALLVLAEMGFCGKRSYLIKVFVEKRYALPYRVLKALVNHFTRFVDETRVMPVIWHQSLLAFVQRYKDELEKEEKKRLRILVEKQKHYLVTPDILWELDHSRNRGEQVDPTLPNSGCYKPAEEDRFDMPPVPMEED